METKINQLLTQVASIDEMLQLMQRNHDMMVDQLKGKLDELKLQLKQLESKAAEAKVENVDQPAPEVAEPKSEPKPAPEVAEPKSEPKPTPEVAEHEPELKPDIMSTFTINDRFLFLRELFDGDERRFNETLSSIQHMSNMNQVENYIADVLNWDHSNEVVKEFTRLVSRSFE